MSSPFLKARKKPVRAEDAIQRAIVEYIHTLGKQLPIQVAHVANQGKRSPRQGADLKAMGLLPGFCDLIIMLGPIKHTTVKSPSNLPKVFFVEVKAEKGKFSKAQIEFGQWCIDNRFSICIARSVTDIQDLLRPHISAARRV